MLHNSALAAGGYPILALILTYLRQGNRERADFARGQIRHQQFQLDRIGGNLQLLAIDEPALQHRLVSRLWQVECRGLRKHFTCLRPIRSQKASNNFNLPGPLSLVQIQIQAGEIDLAARFNRSCARVAKAVIGIAVASIGRFIACTRSATELAEGGCGGSVV